MHDPNHPVWPILRMALILGTLVFVLWMNASHFDDTEIKTILTMFFTLLGAEGIARTLSGRSRS